MFVADQVQEDDKRAVLLAVFRNDFAPIASECSLLADIVAKAENRAALKNLAKVDLWTSLRLRRSLAPPRRSVIDFGFNDMVPHVAARKTHQRL